MALIHSSNSSQICSLHRKPISLSSVLPPLSLSFPLYSTRLLVNFVAKKECDGGGAVRSSTEAIANGSPRKRAASPTADEEPEKEYSDDMSDKEAHGDGDTWVDWEDRILEDTVPLVGFVKMILHSGSKCNTYANIQIPTFGWWTESKFVYKLVEGELDTCTYRMFG